MKILSLNVRVWTRDTDALTDNYWRLRYDRINKYIRSEQPDVICLQEVWTPAAKAIMRDLDYTKVGCAGLSHPIYVRKGLNATGYKSSVHWSRCDVGGYRIVNIHGKWTDEVTDKLVADVNGMVKGKTIACGDYNVEVARLRDLLMQSARVRLGLPAQDTFCNYDKPESHGEIDHFMLANCSPCSYRVGQSDLSDHRPVVLTI